MIISEKQKEPSFHPKGEWDEQRCIHNPGHEWKMCFWDNATAVALAICTKCAEVRGGWAKHDNQ